MSVFDDPSGKLQWLEDELLEEEIDEEEDEYEYEPEPPRKPWGRKARREPHWEEPVSMADREAVFVEKKKQEKGIRRLKFLAFLEVLAILLIIWWWIKWLY